MRTALLLLALLTIVGTAAHATVIKVDWTGAGGYLTIQEGLNVAGDGDTVLVAKGTYSGAGNDRLTFGSGYTVLRSMDGAAATTIDCMGNGRAFRFYSGHGAGVVDGFTIKNGYAWTCNEAYGGGMWIEDSSPTVKNCVFSNCSASEGGAVSLRNSSATFIECEFSGNSGYVGGGMTSRNSSPSLTYCTFTDNTTDNFGGGMMCYDGGVAVLSHCSFSGNSAGAGGGFHCQMTSSPILVDCTFLGNTATYEGAGLSCRHSSSPQVTDCLFQDNVADQFGGGATCTSSSTPSFTDCTFSGNSALFSGGGVYTEQSTPVLTRCTLSGNSSSQGGGMCCNNVGSNTTIQDCVLSGNTSSGALQCVNGSSPTVMGSTFYGNSSAYGAGAILLMGQDDNPVISNCTISSNQAPYGSAISATGSSSPTIQNCIISFNQGVEYVVRCDSWSSNMVLTCCDIYGNAGGDWTDCTASQSGINGNMSVDPLFCDAPHSDYTLCANSPCLPLANECGLLVGARDEGCDPCSGTGIEESDREASWGTIKAMFR